MNSGIMLGNLPKSPSRLIASVLPSSQFILKVVVEWLTILLRIGGSGVQISVRKPAILIEFFCGFPQSLQANDRIVP
jgi:hypothetical protein